MSNTNKQNKTFFCFALLSASDFVEDIRRKSGFRDEKPYAVERRSTGAAMRPCRYCNAALENNETACPDCGREQPTGPSPAAATMPQVNPVPDTSPSRRTILKWWFIGFATLALIPALGYWADGSRGFSVGIGFDIFVILAIVKITNPLI